jgi:hypothetical protein
MENEMMTMTAHGENNKDLVKLVNRMRARLSTLKTKRHIRTEVPGFLAEMCANLNRICRSPRARDHASSGTMVEVLAERLERSRERFHRLDALALSEWQSIQDTLRDFRCARRPVRVEASGRTGEDRLTIRL